MKNDIFPLDLAIFIAFFIPIFIILDINKFDIISFVIATFAFVYLYRIRFKNEKSFSKKL